MLSWNNVPWIWVSVHLTLEVLWKGTKIDRRAKFSSKHGCGLREIQVRWMYYYARYMYFYYQIVTIDYWWKSLFELLLLCLWSYKRGFIMHARTDAYVHVHFWHDHETGSQGAVILTSQPKVHVCVWLYVRTRVHETIVVVLLERNSRRGVV